MDPLELGSLKTLQQRGKLTKRRSRQNTTGRRGAGTSAVLFNKRVNIPNGSVPPKESRSSSSHLTSRDLKAKVVRLGDGWQLDDRSIGSSTDLNQWADSISAFPTDSLTRPPPSTIREGRNKSVNLTSNTVDVRVDHHLWGAVNNKQY